MNDMQIKNICHCYILSELAGNATIIFSKKVTLFVQKGCIRLQCVATFDVTTMALMFEKQCRRAGYSVRVIPVPRSISASCGLACSYPCGDEKAIVDLCKVCHIEFAGLHRV